MVVFNLIQKYYMGLYFHKNASIKGLYFLFIWVYNWSTVSTKRPKN